MPKLQTNRQRKIRYDTIARAEGERCIVCWMEDRIRRGPPRKKLIVEHADNDQSNWAWSNIHLVCYSHNKKMEQLTIEAKKTLLRGYSDHLERERERAGLPTWATVLKDTIPYESGSPEMQAHKRYFPLWKKYVRMKLTEYGSYEKRALVRAAGKFAGCSLQTSRNYMELNTSEEEGPFKEGFDDDGSTIITFLDPPVPAERKEARLCLTAPFVKPNTATGSNTSVPKSTGAIEPPPGGESLKKTKPIRRGDPARSTMAVTQDSGGDQAPGEKAGTGSAGNATRRRKEDR